MKQINNDNEALFDALFNYAVKENAVRETMSIPPKDELEIGYKFSEEFENKINVLIKKHRNIRTIKKAYKYGRKIAIYAAFVITLSFGALMTVEAVQEAVVSTVVEWYDKYNSYIFQNTGRQNTEEILSASNAGKLKYIPKGYVLENFEEMGENNIYFYVNNAGKNMVFRSSIIADTHTTFIDNENTDSEKIEIDGKEAYLFIGKDNSNSSVSLKWIDDNILYSIDAQVSVIELIRIAKSVK